MSAVLKAAPQPLSALHPDERAARVRLAACYRVFDAGLDRDDLQPHHGATARAVSGAEKQFLINPFGLHYSEVTASNLLKIDLAGDVLGQPLTRSTRRLHAARHPARRHVTARTA
jgi:ribulose-5-phosphate 4-epimerase/fuculose-1-phosphate aldolase